MDSQSDHNKRLEAEREAREKLDAFNAELSGMLSGYRAKHLPEGHANREDYRQRQAEKARAQMSALEALLASDSAYAALYNETFNKLRGAECKTEVAMAHALETLERTGRELADALDKANTLPDGRKVFRDPVSGSAYDQHGNAVTGDDLDAVVWRDDAPTWPDYRAKQQADRDARDRLDALRHFQDRLGDYRNRMEDRDNPPSADELKRIHDEIIETAPPEIVQKLVPADAAPLADATPPSGVVKPPL